MTFGFLLGNLIGRALVSFALVWIVCLLCSRFDWRLASVRSRRWYGVLATLALTLLGVGATVAAAGGLR